MFLAQPVPTDEHAKAIEAAQALFNSLSTLDAVAPVPMHRVSSAHSKVDTSPEAREGRFRDWIGMLVEKLESADPIDLGMLITARKVIWRVALDGSASPGTW